MKIQVLRILLAPALAFFGFWLYSNAITLASQIIPTPHDRQFFFIAVLAQEFIAAASVALVFSYPLAYIYRKAAWLAAVAICVPVFWFRASELLEVTSRVPLFAISFYGLSSLALLVIGGTAISAKNLNSRQRLKMLEPNETSGIVTAQK